jgi:sugar lactone lactonase YvrE
VRTIASGLGVLENLEPDGTGGMLLSNNGANRIDRLTPSGRVSPLISGVPSPGGERIRGRYLYFNTGDSAQAGVLGTDDGTIQRYDLRSRSLSTWSSHLFMPNGLIFLPSGDAVVSRVNGGTGLTRILEADPANPQYNWVQTTDSNGLAIDPTGTWIYWDQTFAEGNDVMRARIADPSDVQTVASLGNGLVLDDMTIDRTGVLYIASNRPAPLGEIIRFDPTTKQQCVIASGLGDPSAVKFGCGPGWSERHLYAVSFSGDVYDISPLAGVAAPRGVCDATASMA